MLRKVENDDGVKKEKYHLEEQKRREREGKEEIAVQRERVKVR